MTLERLGLATCLLDMALRKKEKTEPLSTVTHQCCAYVSLASHAYCIPLHCTTQTPVLCVYRTRINNSRGSEVPLSQWYTECSIKAPRAWKTDPDNQRKGSHAAANLQRSVRPDPEVSDYVGHPWTVRKIHAILSVVLCTLHIGPSLRQ